MARKIAAFILLILTISTAFSQNNFNCYPENVYFKNVAYYKRPNYENNPFLMESHYDYINVALTLTANCTDDYERICAIYKWICDNIKYDTSYKIYDADNCFDNRKGVCQAYCNLFYHIAKSIGIRTEIIGGKSKDYYGNINSSGHAWIFAYTDDSHGILLDPTWGAGSVNGKEFIKSDDCWIWFNVSPEWMILSHFPDDESYQLLDKPMSLSKFYTLTPTNSLWIEYGLNSEVLYNKLMNGTLSMPTFYSNGEGQFKFIDIPIQESLKIGQTYTFRIKLLEQNDICIINGSTFSRTEDWEYEGNGIYSINFMPRETDYVSFNIKKNHEDIWNTMIQYEIERPCQNDWDNVNNVYPLKNPEISKVKNIHYADEWENAGIDNHKLSQLIKENNVEVLPVIYSDMGKEIRIISFPMNMILESGTTYTFTFYPKKGINWALINNDKWHKGWTESPDGKLSMTITPERGELGLYIQYGEGESYHSIIKYECE